MNFQVKFRILAAAALLAAACGGPKADAPVPAGAAAAGTTTNAAGAAPKTLTIAVIPKGTTHEFWKSIHAGAVQAGREMGVDVLWKGPQKEDDRAQQITVVEDVISRGVDGIVLAPLEDRARCASGRSAAWRSSASPIAS